MIEPTLFAISVRVLGYGPYAGLYLWTESSGYNIDFKCWRGVSINLGRVYLDLYWM